jgi:hypothetical protein
MIHSLWLQIKVESYAALSMGLSFLKEPEE